MKRFYCAGVVGLALLFAGAARASDFNGYKGSPGNFNFNFTPGNNMGPGDCGCDKHKYDDGKDGKDPYGDKHDNHHYDHGMKGCDPAAVPLPPASALGAVGLVMAGAVKWLRSRRPAMS